VTVIGRDPECDIVLDDDRVSRRHARLVFDDAAWRLIDLASTNGTLLHGRPLQSAAVQHDGWISFGGLLARFEHSTREREEAESRRREARYRTSISLQRELSPSLGLSALLERLLGSVLQLSGTERALVLLNADDGPLEIAARRGLTDDDLGSAGFRGSVGAIERVIATSRPVTVSDALSDPYLQVRESVIAGGMRALIGLPLVAAGRMIGLIYADSRSPGTSFDELDVEILDSLASHAALAIVVARTHGELRALAANLPATSWTGIVSRHGSRAEEGA
jgi:transcriptional regulator with GAF, ATPase, and Fis domain